MLFKPDLLEKVLSGEKTQTRRLVRPDDVPVLDRQEIVRVHISTGAVRYRVGSTYAGQPGRGKHAQGRIRLLSIRHEDVRQISEEDARAEGFENRVDFWRCWMGLHDLALLRRPVTLFVVGHLTYQAQVSIAEFAMKDRPAQRYDAWALTFEAVK